uniref:GTP-binding protein GEM n=1 Tax=Rodentolepis nana TaxID=102285 RepID=A0A0R3TEC7_RODNA
LETVTVDVDGQLTSLLLIDSGGLEDPDFEVMDSADAYLVVYAIDDRESFKSAQTIISEILGKCKIASAIVLVGNKADLARARTVPSDAIPLRLEGKRMSSQNLYIVHEISFIILFLIRRCEDRMHQTNININNAVGLVD